MKQIVKIKNLTVNFSNNDAIDKDGDLLEDSEKLETLVMTLRIIAEDPFFLNKMIIIPDDCEKYGFSEGKFKFSTMFQFLADMLEE